MVLSVFEEMDMWVSNGIFSGTYIPLIISVFGLFFFLSGISSLWKTHLTVGMEMLISIYAGSYRGKLEVFVHFIVSVGCVIFFLGMAGMVPGVGSWLEQLVFPVFLAFTFWGGLMIFGVFGGLSYFCSKFIPTLNIYLLKLFIICVELVSVLSRPLVMSARLLINMILGTMVVYMMGSLFVHHGGVTMLIAMSSFLLYEIGVCFFQSYIFSMLLAMYMEEVEWVS
uniref:ATP synthase subunit a n=1 Tax=Anadara kagoshimensis TaxID=1390362 RepID=A0A096XAB8_9BIVA|nr:ATPase subunit 6 [Anadara kagoshimensis]UVJ66701.1 ATP synthase F0 subunit 6 [Anadara broughtonii]UVJ66713.1 ATP synthase F0 subunit 6 [Anadara broughtonii]UVJ66725.1 ATP synthase F0 subunit 6 [Anadara broughtonii]